MAYQSNIPLPTDRLRVSQGDLNGNFQTTAGGLGTMLNPNQGYIQFPNQVGTPTATGSQPGFYGSTPALTGLEEIFLQKNIAGPAFLQVPMTASTLSTNAAPVLGTQCYSYLPSGFILQWGSYNAVASGGAVNFSFPFPTLTLNVTATLLNGSANLTAVLRTGAYANNQFFLFFNGGGTVQGTYFAIGY